jgi:hypothetical protein
VADDTITQEEIQKVKECNAQMRQEIRSILNKGSMQSYNSHEQLLLQYHKYSNYLSILKDKDILLTIILYFILTFVQMAYDGIFPSVLANKKIYGGFEFDSDAIGYLQMAVSPLSLTTCTIIDNLIFSVYVSYSKSLYYLQQVDDLHFGRTCYNPNFLPFGIHFQCRKCSRKTFVYSYH